MIVYRLCKTKYATDFSGKGSAIYGGRWNNIGVPVLYTGYNIEICLLELLVNIDFEDIVSYSLITLEIPNNIMVVDPKKLPSNWQKSPPPMELCNITEDFVKANVFYAMEVPSAIIPSAKNFILNCTQPIHETIKCLSVEDFHVDNRLSI